MSIFSELNNLNDISMDDAYADLALQQIRANGYADRYRGSSKSITLIGINFSTEQKNLADWKVVLDNV